MATHCSRKQKNPKMADPIILLVFSLKPWEVVVQKGLPLLHQRVVVEHFPGL